MPRTKTFLIAFLFAFITGILAQGEAIRFWGVKANILLALFAVLACMVPKRTDGMSIVLIGCVFLGWGAVAPLQVWALLAFGIIFFFVRDRLPGTPILNMFILLASGAILFASVIPPFLMFRAPTLFFREFILTLFAGGVIYFLFSSLVAPYHNEPGSENSIRL